MQERGQTAPYHDKWLSTRGVITLLSCKPFSDARMSLLCLQIVRLRDIVEPCFEFLPRDAFLCFAGFLWADLLCIRKDTVKLFWARLKEKVFVFVRKRLEHLERREVLFVRRLKILTASAVRGYKILKEWMRRLHNNVFDCLCVVATSQSLIDRGGQLLRLDTSKLVLNGVPIVH